MACWAFVYGADVCSIAFQCMHVKSIHVKTWGHLGNWNSTPATGLTEKMHVT